jgi:D-alanyl-lipoteichoic acid acyltransferase DltB (MBOAT superfamily)
MPLGGSRVGFAKTIRNIFIIFVVSGFWHGANWTFIAWGALNALYFVPLYVFGMNRQHLSVVAENSALPTPKETLQMLVTFTLTCIAWVFFRAESMKHALDYLAGIFTGPFLPKSFWYFNLFTLCAIAFTVAVEWRFRRCEHPFQTAGLPRPLRWSLYLGMFFLVLNFLQYKAEFIYFQF